MPLSGPAATMATLNPGFSVPTFAGMALFNGTTPVLVSADGDHTTFNRYGGSGDVNDAGNWVGPTAVSPVGNEPRLAGGSKGLVMLYTVGTPGKFRLAARKFGGTAFGPAVGVSEKADPIEADLNTATSSGAFHAVWKDNTGAHDKFKWATSANGFGWTTPATLYTGVAADDAYALQVAAAPDRQGFVTWDQSDNTGPVRVSTLEPLVGIPVASVTVGGEEITLFAPGACVKAGTEITLTVTHKTKVKLSPTKKVKIVFVVFSLDKKTKKDKKAGFHKKFSTKGFASKSSHNVGAKVRLRPAKGNGKQTTKELKGSFKIC
jgi:hypothetical protein